MASRKLTVGAALAFAVLISSLIVYKWHRLTTASEPTADEYLVYSSLLRHLATDDLFAKKRLAVIDQTIKLSLPTYDLLAPYQPPTPSDLKITLIDDSTFTDFGDFCGRCAKDFVSKNLMHWSLRPSPGLPTVDAARPQLWDRNVAAVTVSRVGFNFWHTRAVVTYEADCSDAEKSLMCLEIGKASLKREHGRWTVEQLFATLH
jgi:hypothetical protein